MEVEGGSAGSKRARIKVLEADSSRVIEVLGDLTTTIVDLRMDIQKNSDDLGP